MKYRKRRVNLSLVLLFGLLAIALLPIGICIRNAYAIYSSDTTSYVKVGELYDDAEGMMNPDNVNTLLRYITGNSSITYENALDTLNALATSTQSSADIRSKSVTVNGVTKSSSQDVIVRFGGLDWQVVYLSKDTDGNNILTLWLSSSQQDAFAGRTADEGTLYGFIDNSLYSDWSNDLAIGGSSSSYPNNMYGRSYIRSVTLNNGGEYSTSDSQITSSMQSENNVFARFTMEDIDNSLTQYIVTPSQMSWQVLQSATALLSGLTYFYPNDSIEDPAGSGLSGMWYSSSCNYKDKVGYKDWAYDYLWLPSIGETGYDSSHIGLWETSTKQRQNFSSSTSNNGTVGSNNKASIGSYNIFWLRSGEYNSGIYVLSSRSSGNGYFGHFSLNSYAVRPALHLNLSKVIEETKPQSFKITLDDNGGSGGAGEIFVSGNGYFSDEELTNSLSSLSTLPTRRGFFLLGYYTAQDGGTQLISSNGRFLQNGSYFNSDITLYAHWEAKIIEVELEANATNGDSGYDYIYLVYGDGWYSDDTFTERITSVPIPESPGLTFNGYKTNSDGAGDTLIDSTGKIIASNTYFSADDGEPGDFPTSYETIYGDWKANNPAYNDEEGGYRYVESGYMPQSKVDSTLKSTLSSSWSSLPLSNIYYFAGMSLQSRMYLNKEYCLYNDNYYLVEPIKWRLEANLSYIPPGGHFYGTDRKTSAVLAEIVYVDAFSDNYIGAGAGYSSESVTEFMKNQIDSTYLVTESKSMSTFGTTSLKGTAQSVSGNIFVASYDDLKNFATSMIEKDLLGNIKFSDLVKDYLLSNGKDLMFYTRDLGTNYNNFVCINANGDRVQYKANNMLGVMFTIEVTEHGYV